MPPISGLPQAPNTQKRPTSATVFAVLHIIFGVLGTCGVISTFIGLLFPEALSFGQSNPAMDAFAANGTATAVNWVSSIWGVVTVILMLTAGIGLLSIKPYGRTCSIYYAFSSLGAIIFQFVTYLMVMMPLLDQVLETMRDNPAGDAAQQAAMEMSIEVTPYITLVMLVISAIYPTLVLIFMNRRPILELYKPGYVSDQNVFTKPQQALPADYTPPDQSNPYSSPFDPK
ncbi:MAG: hypothetical protein MPJ50_14755 [Pirellulales bacterium]|nr:hypothetical protein [Pirellulales bacterium]